MGKTRVSITQDLWLSVEESIYPVTSLAVCLASVYVQYPVHRSRIDENSIDKTSFNRSQRISLLQMIPKNTGEKRGIYCWKEVRSSCNVIYLQGYTTADAPKHKEALTQMLHLQSNFQKKLQIISNIMIYQYLQFVGFV